jgi:N-acetyl-1-D-myo-inositol-2-amino-2-deoxy-alpha-D-glucopyranoside deacetylase
MQPAEWIAGAQCVLFVHAHPDDEAIFTGGTIAALNATGRQAAVLTLTRGERGEVVEGPLKRLERTPALAEHRKEELTAALDALGVTHRAILGTGLARTLGKGDRIYEDSGMTWGDNGLATAAPDVSAQALTKAEIAETLADVITYADAIGADALVSYDESGGYGHPDHVFAHRLTRSVAIGLDLPFWQVVSEQPDAHVHDVAEWFTQKSAAMAAHASQLTVRGAEFELSGGQVHPIGIRECFMRVEA